MRRDCKPCLVVDDEYMDLTRVEFTDQQIKERWLQKALNRNPGILPVSDLDSSFAPLVSLGREILNIDNLFVSPSGRITVVETKLWRNRESTRMAISQIMDYAQKLRELGYEELQEKAWAATDPTLGRGQTVHELVSGKHLEETEGEAEFIDSVNKTLRSARFMLLVVGDGIKENLEGMVDLLQTQPQMRFTFRLVELQVYEHKPTNGKLIIPQVVAHSTEIVRAVVNVKTEGRAEVRVSMEPEAKQGSGRRVRLDEAEFYDSMEDEAVREGWRGIIDEAKEIGFKLEFASKSVSLCVPHPYKDGLQPVFRLATSGHAFPHAKSGNRTEEDKRVRSILMCMADRVGALLNIPRNPDKPRLTAKPEAGAVLARRDQLLDILKDTFNEINALRAEAESCG